MGLLGQNWQEGYSINGRYVFMGTANTGCGIFNDTDTKWMVYSYRNAGTFLYYNGSKRMETTNDGVTVTGTLSASNHVSCTNLNATYVVCSGVNTPKLYRSNTAWSIECENGLDITGTYSKSVGSVSYTHLTLPTIYSV